MSWEQLTVDELSFVVTKGTTPTTYGMPFTDYGVNFIKAEALNGDSSLDRSGFTYVAEDTHEKLKRSQLQVNDVLITIAGANVGKCGLVRDSHLPANTNQAVALIRVDPDKADPRFIYYHFKQPWMPAYCRNLGGQAAQPNLNLSNLKKFKVGLPDLPTQERIAGVLSAYDDLIENNRRRIALLEQAARLLYREWFVHFRFPGYETTKFVDGLPEGWVLRTISEVCETIGGGTPSTKVQSYWDGGDVTWVTPTDITRNDCVALLDSEKKITRQGLQKSSAKLVPPFTILMTSRASVGFFGISDREVCTNQGFINIVPNDDVFRHYMLFNLMYRVEEIRSHAGGSTYSEISKGKFRALPIVVPENGSLAAFDVKIDPMMKQVRSLKKSISALTKARDLLLPRLMDGRLPIPE